MKYNIRGQELPDSTPIELPLRFKRPPTLQEQIKQMVRHEVSRTAEEQGFESFEEADDFAVEDDDMPVSRHELSPMQEEFRYAKPDKSVLDKPKEKEDDDGAVNKDRIKEKSDGGRKDGKDGQRVDRGVVEGDGKVVGKEGK